jgi:hypothetical protein
VKNAETEGNSSIKMSNTNLKIIKEKEIKTLNDKTSVESVGCVPATPKMGDGSI